MTSLSDVAGFPTTESILSPLLIGLHYDNSRFDSVGLAAKGAISALPTSRATLNLLFKGERKPRGIEHDRLAYHGTDGSGDPIIRLCDKHPNEEPQSAWPRWLWEVSYVATNEAAKETSIAGVSTYVRLVVKRFRLNDGRVEASTQLAFFRHMFTEGLRGLDPNLVILGGQHHWKDAWWAPKSESSLA